MIKKYIKNLKIYLPLYRLVHKKQYDYWNMVTNEISSVAEELRNNGCYFMFVLPPTATHIKGLSKFEKERIKSWTFDFNHIGEEDAKIISKLYPDDVDADYIKLLYEGAKVVSLNGRKHLLDYKSDNVNIVQGVRVTTDAPSKYDRSIHIYGSCTARGTGVSDRDTISSFIQYRVNELTKGKVRCVNHGIGCGSTVMDDIYAIRKTVFSSGDIIVLCNILSGCADSLIKKKVDFYDSSTCFNRPHGYGEWFTDATAHTNRIGNRVIADYIFSIIDKKGILTDATTQSGESSNKFVLTSPADKESVDLWASSSEFKNYENYLKNNKEDKGGINGAIVMNCNPFTLGHRYLIEKAAAQVDTLFIFVVEEDKSYFSFEDRIKLVIEGTKDISNVRVLKSGSFIISAVTFPGYFYKDNNKEAIVDTSNDIDLFANHIAPILGITVRFAGEEPLDPITCQYNNTMRERLPVYNIRFVEIPRKDDGKEVISASRVRKYIEEGKWENIRKLVPTTTYNYLSKRFLGYGK